MSHARLESLSQLILCTLENFGKTKYFTENRQVRIDVCNKQI